MRTAFWTTAIGLGLVLICSWHACSMAAAAAAASSAAPAAATLQPSLNAAAPATSPAAATPPAAAPPPSTSVAVAALHLSLTANSSTPSCPAPSAPTSPSPPVPSPPPSSPSCCAFINLHKNILIAMRLRSLLLLFAAYQRHVMSPPTPAQPSTDQADRRMQPCADH